MSVFFWMPALFANEVSFYFQDGEEDDWEIDSPSNYVSIWNETTEEPVPVPEGFAYMPFTFDSATTLRIYPSDFDFEVVVSVDGDLDTYILNHEDTEWYLTLLPDADGLEIYVKVYLAGQAPGGDTVTEVNMGFNVSAASGSGIDNPGSLIGINYFDRSTFTEKSVEISDNYGSASVVPGTSFTISPAEGYDIKSITTFSEGVASISEPGSDTKEWYVSVSESPADSFASFFITLDKADDQGDDEPSKYGVITQIEPLQWTVTWESYTYINPLDSEYDKNYATLTDANGKTTTLHANLHGYENPTIIFPEYGNYFTLNLEGLNLADGPYILNIPEGYISLIQAGASREPNPAQELGLTIGGTPDVDHEVQFTALNGNYFDITWENVTSLTEGNTKGAYMENMFTGERYDLYYLEDYNYSTANLRIYNGNTLRVNITNNYPDLPTGYYLFNLPAGYVKFNGTEASNDVIENHEIFYVKPWSEGEVEFNGPSDDNKLTLTWVDATEIEYDTAYPGDGDKVKGVTIYDGKDNKIDVSYEDNISISGNVMTVDLNGLNIAEGECRVMVPEDCLLVTVNGETNYTYGVAFTFQYGDPDIDPEIPLYGPATWNVKSFDKVKAGTLVEVNWKNADLTLVPDAEEASIHTPETGILYLEYGTEVYLSEDKTKLLLDLSKQPNGTFRVNVPEACVEFTIDGTLYRNESSSMDNIIIDNTGAVVSFEADKDGRIRVYNINGVQVLDTDNATDVINLPKGVYIINGKKVIR